MQHKAYSKKHSKLAEREHEREREREREGREREREEKERESEWQREADRGESGSKQKVITKSNELRKNCGLCLIKQVYKSIYPVKCSASHCLCLSLYIPCMYVHIGYMY